MKRKILSCMLIVCLIMTMMPSMAWATGEVPEVNPVELNISDGSITITETGYKQGDASDETAYTGDYVITQTGTDVLANYIHITGGTHDITLDNVNLNGSKTLEQAEAQTLFAGHSTHPGNAKELGPFMVYGDAKATVTLVGTNSFTSSNVSAGVEVVHGSTLTITGDGELRATANRNECNGIGSSRWRKTGTVTINSGTIIAKAAGAYVSGIGPGRSQGGGTFVINGGNISSSSGKKYAIGNSAGAMADKVEINGGIVKDIGINATTVEMTAGTVELGSKGITGSTVIITGGNINDAYTGNISGRTLTHLFVKNPETAAPMATTKVKVVAGDESWIAHTNAKGEITTYLAEDTQSLDMTVYTDEGEFTYEDVVITPNGALIGVSCGCDVDSCSIEALLPYKEVTILADDYKIQLDSKFVASEDCQAPDGFHGEYEIAKTYTIEKVLQNGTPVRTAQYAKIEDNVLTVHRDTNLEDYTVYLNVTSKMDVVSDSVSLKVKTSPLDGSAAGVLDLEAGSIVITEAGYKQGDAAIETPYTGDYVITQSNTAATANTVSVTSGTHEITLDGVNITNNSTSPFAISGNANATVIVKGENTLKTSANRGTLEIIKGSTATLKVPEGEADSYGVLTVINNHHEAAAIGGHRSADAGTVNIKSGTFNLKKEAGNYATPLGAGRLHTMEKISVSGGVVMITGSNNCNIGSAANGRTLQLEITGGTISSNGKTFAADAVSITGGNINDTYTGAISGYQLVKMYFVESDGTPIADTAVTLGDVTAFTNQNGEFTTYLASDLNTVTATYNGRTEEEPIVKGKVLFGADCTCNEIETLTWNAGLPEAVTLYADMAYTVNPAEYTAKGDCVMPIHPSVPELTYNLAVYSDSGEEIASTNYYAVLETDILTLKQEYAPYEVVLTAECGDKTVSKRISVTKGTAEAESVICVTEGDSTKEIAVDGGNENGHILTGNAKSAQLTVNADAQTVKLAQDNEDNVWKISGGESVNRLTIDVSGKTEGKTFVSHADKMVIWTKVEDGQVKFNLNGGNVVINEDGTYRQGTYTFANAKEYVVVGASTVDARTITNNSGETVKLSLNGEMITIPAGETYTVEQAAGALYDTDTYAASYLLPNGTDTYKLIVVGDVDTTGIGFYSGQQERITEVWFDPDLETLSHRILDYTRSLNHVSFDYAKNIECLYSYRGKSIHFGPQVEYIKWDNYMTNLESVTVDADNQFYKVVDGALYTMDGKTLLGIPKMKTGSYKTLSTCEEIGWVALYGSMLDSITLGENVKTIGSRVFEASSIKNIYVAEANPYFKSVDGVLFDKQMTTLLYYPQYKTDKNYALPDGVTEVSSFGLSGNQNLEELTLPDNNITAGRYGFLGLRNLKKLTLQENMPGQFSGAKKLDTLVVPEEYDWTTNAYGADSDQAATPMLWLPNAKVTVSKEVFTYDGTPKTGVTVSQELKDVTIEYSKDNQTWSSEAPTFTQPGTHTVYFRLTKAADVYTDEDRAEYSGSCLVGERNGKFEFARSVYSSATFTIKDIDIPTADWFDFTSAREAGSENMAAGADVTLAVGGVPLTAEGYEVQYYDSEGQLLDAVPETAGTYTVKVNITQELYNLYDLAPIELGTYSITEKGMNVISFVTNGGSAIDTITAEPGAEITVPADPERPGYTFLGWYEDVSLRTKVDELPATMPEENTAYYAKWKLATYTITYENMKGAVTKNPATYTVESDDIVLEAPSVPGYEFMGWTYDDHTEETAVIEKGSTGDKTFSANWKLEEYTITYKNYVSGADTYDLTLTKDKGIKLDVPEDRTGYTFAGWQMSNDGVVTIIPLEKGEIPKGTLGNLIISGIWLAEEQTLTLNAGEGTFADGKHVQTVTTEYDGSVTLTAPERANYDFAGWFEDEACTVPFEAETMPLTMTIYAKWTPVVYTITYDGVTDAVNNNPATYTIESAAITLTAPAKTGYVFTGWTYEGQTTPVKTVVIPKGSYGNKAYTANWTPVVYTITYGGVAGAVNSNPATYTIESAAITLTAPAKAGYVFTGWTYAGQTAPVKTVVIPKGSMGNKAYTANFMMIPTAPAKVTTALYGYDDIKVTWKAATGATSYQVYMKKGSGAYKLVKTTSSLTYKAKNLADGAKYTFKVVAYNGTLAGGEKASSAIYTLKKVTGVKVVKSGKKVKVSWKNIEGETGYQISKMTKKKGTQKKPTTYKTTKGKYKKLAAAKGKTYYYKVRAYKTVNGKKIYGPWSAVKKFKRK